MAKQALDKPSRRTIDALFKDLDRRTRYRGSEYSKAHEELEALEKELRKDPRYVRLKKRLDEAEADYYEQERVRMAKVRAVRLEYQAKGLTDGVRKKIEALVEEFVGHGE